MRIFPQPQGLLDGISSTDGVIFCRRKLPLPSIGRADTVRSPCGESETFPFTGGLKRSVVTISLGETRWQTSVHNIIIMRLHKIMTVQ